jgi:hypothetical protein
MLHIISNYFYQYDSSNSGGHKFVNQLILYLQIQYLMEIVENH